MDNHKTATREEWLAARLKLLEAEKELTRQSDAVAKQRQELPWVLIDKDYYFETDEGKVPFRELFKGRSQLLIYHFMFGPNYKAGCPNCSAIADGFNGIFTHLANHDVMLWAVSRAPLEKLLAYRKRMGWTFPWASSFESDFNYDFNVSYTKEQQQSGNVEYNYRKGNVSSRSNEIEKIEPVSEAGEKIAAMVGTDWATFTRESPGMSAFVMEDGIIYHTYSSFERGLDGLWNMYQWLDRAPKGRNEKGMWTQRHDEYDQQFPNKDASKDCCG